jgi:hypothetical protein
MFIRYTCITTIAYERNILHAVPNPKIIEVIETSRRDFRRDFSLQELLQMASQLSNDETIFCSTPITPIIRLMVELNNKLEQTDVVQISLMFSITLICGLIFLSHLTIDSFKEHI